MTALTSVLKSGQDMKINTTQYEQRETPHLFNIQWYITVCTIAPTIYKNPQHFWNRLTCFFINFSKHD